MKITLLQLNPEWGDAKANIQKAEAAVKAAGPSDLFVLPEMWSSGFTMQPEIHSENEPGEALEWMKLTSSRTGAAVAGSIAVRSGDCFRNRFYFVKPDGSVAYYDKHHLFTYSGEDGHYEAGNERLNVEWKGVRFRLIVCYDLRFPVWCRNRGDYDVLLCVASWPDRRADAWKLLLRARAVENQCYVVAVNRVGNDPTCHYTGDSAAIDAYGRAVSECRSGEEGFCSFETDMIGLAEFRAKFPVLRDADKI